MKKRIIFVLLMINIFIFSGCKPLGDYLVPNSEITQKPIYSKNKYKIDFNVSGKIIINTYSDNKLWNKDLLLPEYSKFFKNKIKGIDDLYEHNDIFFIAKLYLNNYLNKHPKEKNKLLKLKEKNLKEYQDKLNNLYLKMYVKAFYFKYGRPYVKFEKNNANSINMYIYAKSFPGCWGDLFNCHSYRCRLCNQIHYLRLNENTDNIKVTYACLNKKYLEIDLEIIGRKRVYYSGKKAFKISYRIAGILGYDGEHKELKYLIYNNKKYYNDGKQNKYIQLKNFVNKVKLIFDNKDIDPSINKNVELFDVKDFLNRDDNYLKVFLNCKRKRYLFPIRKTLNISWEELNSILRLKKLEGLDDKFLVKIKNSKIIDVDYLTLRDYLLPDSKEYRKIRNSENIDVLMKFLIKYPNSRYCKNIMDNIYYIVFHAKSIQDLENHVSSIYKFQNFIENYPNSYYKEKILKELSLLIKENVGMKYYKLFNLNEKICKKDSIIWKGKVENGKPIGSGYFVCHSWISDSILQESKIKFEDINQAKGYVETTLYKANNYLLFVKYNELKKVENEFNSYNNIAQVIEKNIEELTENISSKKIILKYSGNHKGHYTYNIYINGKFDGQIFYYWSNSDNDYKFMTSGTSHSVNGYYAPNLTFNNLYTPQCGKTTVGSVEEAIKKAVNCAYKGHY